MGPFASLPHLYSETISFSKLYPVVTIVATTDWLKRKEKRTPAPQNMRRNMDIDEPRFRQRAFNIVLKGYFFDGFFRSFMLSPQMEAAWTGTKGSYCIAFRWYLEKFHVLGPERRDPTVQHFVHTFPGESLFSHSAVITANEVQIAVGAEASNFSYFHSDS